VIESAIRYILVNDNAVKAITTRCYPVMLPQNPVYPLILYTKISGMRDHHLNGSSGKAHPRFQIDAWGETYAQAKSLAGAIRDALDSYEGTVDTTKIGSCLLISEIDTYESEIKIFRTIMDFIIWHDE